MALIKLTELPTTTTLSVASADWLMVVQGGVNKKISFANALKSVQSEVVFNSTLGTSNFIVNGLANPNLLKVDTASNKIGIGTSAPDTLLHVNGTVKIGGTASPGSLILSSENLSVPASGTMIVSSSFIVTNLETVTNSLSTMALAIGAPNDMQFKIVTYSKAFAGRESSQNFTMSGPFNGFAVLKFSKLGDSAILLGVNSKWTLVGYNGAVIIT